MAKDSERPRLGRLENAVMQIVWARPRVTAEDVRLALGRRKPLKESTVRTILRRLEEKGFLEHDVEGRTYVYRPRHEAQSVAAQHVRGIVERFCQGSVESLLVGMVDDKLITPQELRILAQKIADAEASQKRSERGKK